MVSRGEIGAIDPPNPKGGKEVRRMKKPLSAAARQLEAEHWRALKKALSEKPVKVCRK